MSEIYVVTDGSYSDYHIKGIYSTMEKAEEAKDLFQAENDIETIELDSIPDHPPGLGLWVVSLKKNGEVLAGGDYYQTPRRYGVGEIDRDYYPRWNYKTSPDIKSLTIDHVDFYVWARDADHALKIAHEHWAQLIASNEWTDDFDLWWKRIWKRAKEEK